MAEILVKAVDATHPDSDKDRKGAYKRGMPVVVMPDGQSWGNEERLPKFIVIKIPGVPVEKVKKYIDPEYQGLDADGQPVTYRRREWHISWADLPQGVKERILANGGLTIKVASYSGPYDYTWPQVKAYFKGITSGLSETVDL